MENQNKFPNQSKLLLGLVLCCGFIALGFYLVSLETPIAKTVGYANIVFFSLIIAITVYKSIFTK